MEKTLEYARMFNGAPYKWGGNNPLEGFDCSGFVQWILKSKGLDSPGRQDAHELYNYFFKYGKILNKPERGALIFFGSRWHISHVAIALDETRMIHAAGGDSGTIDIPNAIKNSACVREDQITYRKDVIAYIMPNY